MPIVSLLDTETSVLKRLSLKVVSFFKKFANAVIIAHPEEPQEQTHKKESTTTQNPSLFPSRNNVDNSLSLNSTVVPCSMDISTLQSPMSLTRTPEGAMEWRLNDPASIMPGNALPISPSSGSESKHDSQNPKDGEEIDDEEQRGKYVCHYCDAEFRIRGYLTRHIKKHAVEKAYHCPFFNSKLPPESRCHTTGGFSRRDTYKTHLKSRHFIYPKGIKTQERNKSSGNCSHCGEWFENTEKWIENHIETGDCTGLPEGFVGRVKNSRKSGKLKMIKTSTGHSRFISTAQSVIEPNVLLNKDAIEAMAIVVNETRSHGNVQPTITKMGDNRLMLRSENFKGAPKPKKNKLKKIQRKKSPGEECLASTVSSHDSFLSPMDETPLDEICLSMDLSPVEDGALEPVNTGSSVSSHEFCKKTDVLSFSVAAVKIPPIDFNDPCNVPLDMEQCSMYPLIEEQFYKPIEKPHINETLDRQMDPVLVSERQMRETQQYLNFYNSTFHSNL